MADKEHFRILKKGVDAWNSWRGMNPEVRPDLSSAWLDESTLTRFPTSDYFGVSIQHINLSKTDLSGAGLISADLSESDLSEADLSGANLGGAKLVGCILERTNLTDSNLNYGDLRYADLTGANLLNATLVQAKLIKANLTECYLFDANLSGSNLNGANLTSAYLFQTNLHNAELHYANLTRAILNRTLLGDCNLKETKGLNKCLHYGPSVIDHQTIAKSGKLSPTFLRGCGMTTAMIKCFSSLAENPEQLYSCFISYSSKNQTFAARLHSDLQAHGVRCWFAPEHLKIGDKTRTIIDESIREHDKLLVVLSKQSVSSDWVEKEVETALERERQQKRTILFPIRIDDEAMRVNSGWAADIRRARNIGDFRHWRNLSSYHKALARLVRDLKATEDSLESR